MLSCLPEFHRMRKLTFMFPELNFLFLSLNTTILKTVFANSPKSDMGLEIGAGENKFSDLYVQSNCSALLKQRGTAKKNYSKIGRTD